MAFFVIIPASSLWCSGCPFLRREEVEGLTRPVPDFHCRLFDRSVQSEADTPESPSRLRECREMEWACEKELERLIREAQT